MTQKQKDLLLKDLCARLPYGVEVEYDNCTCEVLSIDRYHEELTIRKSPGYHPDVKIEDVKPYLFPMSSITIDQWNDFGEFTTNDITYVGANVDWFNTNHFDYRGLIEKGLAIDATGKNIY